ncbi:MAG: aminotransferase class V-fold PLP-dependent enzyme [Planctomycetota bacterium]
MLDRRRFLGALGLPPAAALGSCSSVDRCRAKRAIEALRGEDRPAEDVARDESFWREVQLAFSVDRSMVNLNNGGVSPSPSFVHEKYQQHLAYANQAPPYHMWRIQEPHKEPVRQRLARFLDCDPEEVAITRNASESLMVCQHGIDLEPGDEVLTTNQDYPRMRNAFAQRARREGISVREISLPGPDAGDDEVVEAFARAITDRTRLLLCCHVINLTGRILPVRAIARMARDRGVQVIVDGAHAVAHFPFSLGELECDYYGTSLHKWLFAPIGTGLLHVRRDRIGSLWPLFSANEGQRDDIRKFEEIGTHPAACILAIAEALTFHETLGPDRKLARLVYLRDRWCRRLLENDRVRLHTSLEPGRAGGIATVEIEGIEPCALNSHLWQRYRILTTPIAHAEFRGIRVSPSVYTTIEEIDRFADAMERVARNGLPSA